MTETPHATPAPEPALPVRGRGFPVVGLGASAGGGQSLLSLLQLMPPDSGMAYVVVMHLSPTDASGLPARLAGVTRMRVVAVEGRIRLAPDHVYLIPPNRLLSMDDGHLEARETDSPRGRRGAVDLFFRTLAATHRDRAMAVVLSGDGADGADGIRRIKAEGGLTIAQAPLEAEFDAMPRAAIVSGAVDWVLPLAEMPDKLVALWRDMQRIELPACLEPESHTRPPPLSDAGQALQDVLGLLHERTGHDFRNYKCATVLRRVARRMQVQGVPTLPAYRARLEGQADEAPALLKDMLIGVTSFFRDPDAFDALRLNLLPEMVEQAARSPCGLRIWVPACSTGEEAYSMAMLVEEQMAALPSPPKLQVFATDIDESAIAVARRGRYSAAIEADVSPARLSRFFSREGDHFRVRKDLRGRVMFATHSILRDPPFSRVDLISCRNVLIYFDRHAHGDLLEMFHFALKPGGCLFLGSSESADSRSGLFSVVDKKNGLYRANVLARPSRHVPTLPAGGRGEPARGLSERLPPRDRGTPSHAEVHERFADQYAPPSVLIDGEGVIVHLSERAGRYLRQPGGAPSHQLLNLLDPLLRVELRTALAQSLRSGRSVQARRVRLDDGGRALIVTMTVRPVQVAELGGPLAMVLFDEVEDAMAGDDVAAEPAGRDPLVAALEDEVRRVREQLQASVEQSETSNEELRASNEELQAANEALRSTTEELETSQEELQSINEELLTVNRELKVTAEEAGKVNDDLHNLIASTDMATIFVDRGMTIKRYTPPATRLFKLIPGDVGRSLTDVTHELEYPTLAQDAVEAFQSLRAVEHEVRGPGGRWYLARVLPYRTAEDRIDGAVLTFVDVTPRRAAEESFRMLAQSTNDYAILTFDTEGLVTTWNKGAERIFGYTAAEIVGQPWARLFTADDLRHKAHLDEMRQAREAGRAEDDRWHVRQDGSTFLATGITTPLYDQGQLRGYGKIARDVTGRQRTGAEHEARLRDAEARHLQAQSMVALKDEFLAVMSHELKNPLNLIQLNAELLLRSPDARGIAVVQRAARVIRSTVRSQAQIIDDLLDLSRVNTGKLTLQPATLDMADTVRTILLAVQQEARTSGIELTADLPAQPVVLNADPVRLEQIVWNLLTNAIKFTQTGGRIAVRLAVAEGQAHFEVEDTGLGIAPALLPQVFDMFRQAMPGASRREGGMGIGLALVKSLVGAHGGRVEAHSDGLGHGSRFGLWLPLAESAPCAADGSSAASLLGGRRVLLVDDERDALESLAPLLELEGAVVETAQGGREGLRAVQAAEFDLVISDISMPDMDGHEFVRALHAQPALRALPVIALTGFGRPADARRAMDSGFAAHLRKPLTVERLLDALREVLPH